MDKFNKLLKKMPIIISILIAGFCILGLNIAQIKSGEFDIQIFLFSLLALIPLLFLLLIIKIYPKINNKEMIKWKKNLLKCTAFIIGFLLFCIQIIFLFMTIVIISMSDYDVESSYTKPQQYKYVMQIIEDGYVTTFFPYSIPKEAKDVEFKSKSGGLIDYTKSTVLKFKITDEYIKNIEEEFKYALDNNYSNDKTKAYNIIDKLECLDENHTKSFRGYITINKSLNLVTYYYSVYYSDYLENDCSNSKKYYPGKFKDNYIKINYKKALEYYDLAIQDKPKNPMNYYSRAKIKIKLADKKGAIQDLNKATELTNEDNMLIQINKTLEGIH